MIEYMQGTGDVWFTTMEEIATHVQTCIDNGSWKPRVDQLPYYDEPIPELKDMTLAQATMERSNFTRIPKTFTPLRKCQTRKPL